MDKARREWIKNNVPREENGYEIFYDMQGVMQAHILTCSETLYTQRVCYGKDCICRCHYIDCEEPCAFIGGFTL